MLLAGFQPASMAITQSSCQATKRSRHGFEAGAKPIVEILRKNSFFKNVRLLCRFLGEGWVPPTLRGLPQPCRGCLLW